MIDLRGSNTTVRLACTLFLFVLITPFVYSQTTASNWQAGAAKIDITPKEAMRLSGYGNRIKPTAEMDDPLFARAMAIKHEDQSPLIIVSIDAIGLSATLTDRICSQVQERFSIRRNQMVLCTTHSHSAPQLEDLLPNIFSTPMTDEERSRSVTYSQFVVDSVVRIVGESIAKLQPASIGFGTGHADFAINRRVLKNNVWTGFGTVDDGPVDRTVRVIHAKRLDGTTLAVVYQYATHCTSISPDLNRISADWAGMSAALIENAFQKLSSPDVVALPIIGCGADSNPNPRGTYDNAKSHANEMAQSVQSVCNRTLTALPAPVSQSFQLVAIASERPSRDRLNTLAKSTSVVERNFALSMLDVWKRKGRIPETYPAPVHLWNFGDSFAWVFMGGEVVVDYQIRLEKELSQFPNVWVAAYVDDVFAYVASERMRSEGGYEVDASMLYYNQPGRWVSGTEDVLVTRVLEMARQKRPAETPLSAKESLASIEMAKGWTIELVASEPLVEDPVNIAFGADGAVWVVEMGDYPSGGEKTGRLKRMVDSDGDGKLDKSSIFLDKLSFPSGVYPWRDGVVVASAPEVFIAFDRDHDGIADERRALLTGFPFANPQHRVNGFTYGLDHRLHFCAGSEVNEIVEVASGKRIKVGGSDLSLDVDNGKVYLESGSSQFIRGCDDWGNWFGNDNSHPLFHYVWDRNWPKRAKTTTQHAMQPPSAPPVFPVSRDADRFNDLFAANCFTSACSSIFCRSPGATPEMQGSALVCESVHNLVSRIRIERKGASFVGSRFDEDRRSEWLRSSDPWFRPVRIENAMDGSLWIADMYRRVIEHPEWIPEDWQRRIDVRAGDDRGRIYRAYRTDFTPFATKDWTKASLGELLQGLQSPSSAIAETARQQLVWRYQDNPDRERNTVSEIRTLASRAEEAVVRLRAVAVLLALGKCEPKDWMLACKDSDERVVRWAAETLTKQRLVQGELRDTLIDVSHSEMAHRSAALALQLIVALATCAEPAYVELTQLLVQHASDRWIDASVILLPSSGIDSVIEHLLANENVRTVGMIDQLVSNASQKLKQRLRDGIASGSEQRPAWHFTLSRQFALEDDKAVRLDDVTVEKLQRDSLAIVQNDRADPNIRRAALSWFMSRLGSNDQTGIASLVAVLTRANENDFREPLVKALVSLGEPGIKPVFEKWSRLEQETRAIAISGCLASEPTTIALLSQVADGGIGVDSFQPAQIEQLRGRKSQELRHQVEKLFGPPPGADRVAIVHEYTSKWPANFDASRGQALYKQHCSQCHQDRVEASGVLPAVGPSLQALAGWKNDAWLTAIFDPNKTVEAKYRRVNILTQDGKTIVGLKVRDSEESIEIVNDQGQLISLTRESIDELRESDKSLMPEGFEKILKPEDVASLVTYLRKMR